MAKAYKKCNAAAFAVFLFEFIMRFGVPARLITDQGSNFIGKVGELLAAKLRHRHAVLSKGNSQGNAICERRHRVVNKGLMCQLAAAKCGTKEELALVFGWSGVQHQHNTQQAGSFATHVADGPPTQDFR